MSLLLDALTAKGNKEFVEKERNKQHDSKPTVDSKNLKIKKLNWLILICSGLLSTLILITVTGGVYLNQKIKLEQKKRELVEKAFSVSKGKMQMLENLERQNKLVAKDIRQEISSLNDEILGLGSRLDSTNIRLSNFLIQINTIENQLETLRYSNSLLRNQSEKVSR